MVPTAFLRSHDYRYLIKRWRSVARASGLVMRSFSQVGGYPVYFLRSRKLPQFGIIYISAGIHGDEPGGTEACITWAEQNSETLASLPLLIFPCLNPWGLINNSRNDDQRRDLNRMFQHDEIPVLRELKRLIQPLRFSLALMLHEDYDGHGVYIYEGRTGLESWGDALTSVARKFIATDPRPRIEKRVFRNGVFLRKIRLKLFEKIGLPEAAYLQLHHAERVFTIETPSEFAIDRRVAAQIAIINECVRRVHKTRSK